MKITVDLSKKGLEIFFKDYQAEMLKYLLDNPNKTSREVEEYLTNIITSTRSRASLINSLNECVEYEILSYYEQTGRGGVHRVYSLNEKWDFVSESDICLWIMGKIRNRVVETL